MKYFGYGSNLCTGRLERRVPSARKIVVAKLFAHKLCFHKVSKDHSGKSDARVTGNEQDYVLGVVFEILESEKPALDRAEGLGAGYNERAVSVIDSNGNTHEVVMYYADDNAIDSTLRPYSWYHWFVHEGAIQHGFPPEYIRNNILSVIPIEDPDRPRDRKKRAIQC